MDAAQSSKIGDWAALARVAQSVSPGSDLIDVGGLEGGISARLAVLTVRTPSGSNERFVVRSLPGARSGEVVHPLAREFRILQRMHAHGVPVPEPLALDMRGEILADPYLVMAFVPGAPDYIRQGKSTADLARMLEQMATRLAQIHRLDPATGDLESVPCQADVMARHVAAFAARAGQLAHEARMTDIIARDLPHMAVNPPCLLHGDFWPGNLLWRDGELVTVVDWEDAVMGDPVADLAISRLDLLWIFGRVAMATFTQMYRTRNPALDYSQLAYWDLFAGLRALPWLAQAAANWPRLGRPDITEAAKRTAHGWFTTQALQAIGND